jgi:hypothetical protein
MQEGFSNNVGTSYTVAEGMINQTADGQGWTDDQREGALADLDAAYADVTGWEGLAIAASSLLSEHTAAENQVVAFWGRLSDYAADWTGKNADKLRTTFGAAANATTTVAETTIGGLVDAADTLVVEPLVATAQDVTTVATSRQTYVILGAVALIVLLVAVRR